MPSVISFSYRCRRPASPPFPEETTADLFIDRDDLSFFATWPQAQQKESFESRKGHSSELFGTLITSGTALLTSAAFASLVKAWLASRRRKITISNSRTGNSISYEGPNLHEDIDDIVAAIDRLVGGEAPAELQVSARIPGGEGSA
jgi:hypothetical protein